jgi:hypothetical protein
MQLKVNKYDDSIFEWIPYNEFSLINETEQVSLAIWKKGPLCHNISDNKKLIRKSCEIVGLKRLHSDITDELLNEVLEFSMNLDRILYNINFFYI